MLGLRIAVLSGMVGVVSFGSIPKPCSGQVIDSTWTGLAGSTIWSDQDNWSPDTGYPNNGSGFSYRAAIPSGNSVTVGSFRKVDTLDIASGSTVEVLSDSYLGIEGTGLTNAGTLKLSNTTGNYARLLFYGASAQSLAGGGEVIMSPSTGNIIRSTGDAVHVTSDNTIRGAGYIGADQGGPLQFTNNALVEATHTSNALTLDPVDNPTTGFGFTNNGTLRSAGGWLEFEDGKFDNLAGVIESDGSDAIVTFNSGSYISGGVLRGVNEGQLLVVATSRDATFREVELGGYTRVTPGARLALEGTIDNRDLVSLSGSSDSRANLKLVEDVTLTGGGTIELAGSGNNIIAGIPIVGLYRQLTNENNTIQGMGEIGSDTAGRLSIVNRGTIEANVKDETLRIDPDQTNSTVQFDNESTGKLRATSGGILELASGTYLNDGVIEAETDSLVHLLSDAKIIGGLLKGPAQETGFKVYSSTAKPALLSDVTVDAWLIVPEGSGLILEDEITLNKVLRFEGVADWAQATIQGQVNVTGNGQIQLHGGYTSVRGNGAGSKLTIGPNVTVFAEAGFLGLGDLAIENNGIIFSNNLQPTTVIPIDGPGGFVNRGVLASKPGSTLALAEGQYDNAGGQIRAHSNASFVSFVLLSDGAHVSGGKIGADDKAFIAVGSDAASPAVLQDVEIAHLQSSNPVIRVYDGASLAIRGTITNNAMIALSEGGATEASKLIVQGDATLTTNPIYGGALILSHSQQSQVVGDGTNNRLTIAKNHILAGAGQLGMNTLAVTNHGHINLRSTKITIDPADQPADGGFGLLNDGAITVRENGELRLMQGDYMNQTVIGAILNSNIFLEEGARIYGGELLTDYTGAIYVEPSTGVLPHLGSVDIAGQLYIAPGSGLTMAGNGKMQAIIGIQGENGKPATLILQNQTVPTTWQGEAGGRIALAGGPDVARIHVSGDQPLTNEDQLIVGSGRIGDDLIGPLVFTNKGEIQASPLAPDTTAVIQIDPRDQAGSFVNEGALFAKNNGTILVDDGDLSNQGTILVNAGGALNVVGGFMQTAGKTTIHGTMDVSVGNPIFSGGSVGGFGKINGKPAHVWGTITPGGSIGTLEFEGLRLMDGARIELEVDGASGDQIHVSGTDPDAFSIEDGASLFVDISGRSDGSLQEFALITWDGDDVDRALFDSVTWEFVATRGTLLDTPVMEFRNTGGGGGALMLTNVRYVPEPSAICLTAFGLLGLTGFGRRRIR
jgi:hypothetical protein